jgi:hypothetical protein
MRGAAPVALHNTAAQYPRGPGRQPASCKDIETPQRRSQQSEQAAVITCSERDVFGITAAVVAEGDYDLIAIVASGLNLLTAACESNAYPAGV